MSRRARLVIIVGLMLLALVGLNAAFASSGSEYGSAQSEQAIEGEMEVSTHETTSSDKVWDLIKRTMNAAAVVIVLVFLLRKPLSQALSNRTKSIKEELENLEARKKEAESALDEMLERLKKIQDEKEKVIAEFVVQGEAEKAKILKEAETMAERMKEQARMFIDQEVDKAKSELQQEIAEQAAAKALELIQAKITPEDRDRLVDEYLKQVVREP